MAQGLLSGPWLWRTYSNKLTDAPPTCTIKYADDPPPACTIRYADDPPPTCISDMRMMQPATGRLNIHLVVAEYSHGCRD